MVMLDKFWEKIIVTKKMSPTFDNNADNADRCCEVCSLGFRVTDMIWWSICVTKKEILSQNKEILSQKREIVSQKLCHQQGGDSKMLRGVQLESGVFVSQNQKVLSQN